MNRDNAHVLIDSRLQTMERLGVPILPKPIEIGDYLTISAMVHFPFVEGKPFWAFAAILSGAFPSATVVMDPSDEWFIWRATAPKADPVGAFIELSNAWLALWITHPAGPHISTEAKVKCLNHSVEECFNGGGIMKDGPVEDWQFQIIE